MGLASTGSGTSVLQSPSHVCRNELVIGVGRWVARLAVRYNAHARPLEEAARTVASAGGAKSTYLSY